MSALSLLPFCRYCARTDVRWPFEKTSPAAASGKKIHALAEQEILGHTLIERLTPDEEAKWKHLRAWIRENRRESWRPEVKLAWNPETDTARILTAQGERQVAAVERILRMKGQFLRIDRTGVRAGMFVFLFPAPGKDMWTCRCDCGAIKSLRAYRARQHQNCGCIKKAEIARLRAMPEYLVWKGMRNRCNNPNTPCFSYYGGRGISVCARWESFAKFLADVGARPSANHQLDRINNDGNYEPGNCRWATRKEQALNRRSTRFLTYQGNTLCIADWERLRRFPPTLIKGRLRVGWSIADAIETPARPSGFSVDDDIQ